MRFEVFDYAQHADGSFAPGHSVTIYESDGVTKATLYVSETGGTTSNPIVSDSTGLVHCWVTSTRLYKSVDGGSLTPLKITPPVGGATILATDFPGVEGGGVHNDAPGLNAAFAACPAGGTVYLPPISGGYAIGSTLHIPWNVNVDFGHNQISTLAGASFTNGYMISLNSSDVTTWDHAYPSWRGYEIRNAYLSNVANLVDTYGIFWASSHRLRGIRCDLLYRSIYHPNLYLDLHTIDGLFINQPQGTEYQVEVAGCGDGLDFRSLSMYSSFSPFTMNLLKVYQSEGLHLRNIINGNVYLKRSTVTWDGAHMEFGTILVEGCELAMRNAFIYHRPDLSSDPPLTLASGQWSGQAVANRPVLLENVKFIIHFSDAAKPTAEFADIKMQNYIDAKLINCRRVMMGDNNALLDNTYQAGVRCVDASGASITPINKFSPQISTDGIIVKRQPAQRMCATLPSATTYLQDYAPVRKSSPWNWRGPAATVYYKMAFLLDATRLIGKPDNAGEQSYDPTVDAASWSALHTSGSALGTAQNCWVRVYRGTTSGSYDKYVDVPIVSGQSLGLVDDGLMVNGYFWKDRTAGPIDTFFLATSVEWDPINDSVICRGATAAPTVGTWKVGDVVERVPVVGQPIGWLCTVAGTPGTWVAKANL